MESKLRKDCQCLLKQLHLSQQLLNNEIAAQVELADAVPETVNSSENKDSQILKSAYARSKLLSTAKPSYEDHVKTMVTKVVRSDIVNNKENIYTQNADDVSLQRTGELQSLSKVSSHLDNNVASKSRVQTTQNDTYKHLTAAGDEDVVISSSWQPATPNTQRRRNLIDRHTLVPTKLNSEELRNLNKERMLNFSYSHVSPDDNDIPHLYSENNCDNNESCDNIEDQVKALKSSDNLENQAKVSKIGVKMNQQPENSITHINVTDRQHSEERAAFKGSQKTSDVHQPGVSSNVLPQKTSDVHQPGVSNVLHTFKSQLEDDGNNRKLNSFIRDTTIKPKSLLNSTSYSLQNISASRRNNSGVRFDTSSRNTRDTLPDHRLLGYDWIAALLDNDSDLVDQSESFFNELREFRRAYKDECSNKFYMEGPHTLIDFEPEPVVEALREPKVEPYIVNERLFTEPLQSGLIDYGKSPQRKGSKKEPSADNQRFVRVSIPRSTLQSPYRVKPHRRRSFDASDSCSLMSHCLLGWENAVPSMIPTAKSLDLKTAAGICNDYQKTTLADAERLASATSHAQWPFDKPTPRLQLLPLWKKHYMDTALKMSMPPASVNSSVSRASGGSESVKRATDKLLNSAYATMYEMERLKEERRLENMMREKKK